MPIMKKGVALWHDCQNRVNSSFFFTTK